MLIAKYIKTNLRAAMEYRAAFFLQVFGMVLNNAAFIFFWKLLLNRIGGDLNGYGFTDIMYLWALVSTSFGLSVTFFGNGPNLSKLIMDGDLDVYLLQPARLLPNILASRMQVSGLGDVAYGIVLFALTQGGGMFSWLAFLCFCFLGMLMCTAVSILYHSLTFFVGNAQNTAQLAKEGFISFSIYPGTIFDGPVRLILQSLIPVAWSAWIPGEIAADILNGIVHWQKIVLMLGADLIFVSISIAFFYIGVQRYESGNRIGARL